MPLSFASYYDDGPLEQRWYVRARAYMEHWVTIAQNNSGYFNVMKEGDWGNLYPGTRRCAPTACTCVRACMCVPCCMCVDVCC